ncbi:MAG TPA: ATPase, partial [Cycloclasticus sp.]|nr:ATPase [Cycloclasticus sp.]
MDNKDAHLIVLGNEKGGTGKSTLAMHIVVGLLDVGKKVAVIDLDSRQKSVARYLQNRQTFMVNGGAKVTMPEFIVVAQSEASLIKDREIEDQKNLQAGLDLHKKKVDYIVIDCPGNDTYLSRLAHALADTLVTPLNDSFID